MQWVTENWLILLLGGGMIAMHLFGHGHGGHGKSKSKQDAKADDSDSTDPDERA